MKFKKISFWVLVILSIAISQDNEMSLIIPMGLLTYRFRNVLIKFLDKFSFPVAFIGSGLTFGLLTELFAIWGNLGKPLAQQQLLSPYPHVDLILGFFWYGLFVIVWYFLVKRYKYTFTEIFLLAGLYGLIFELGGEYLKMLLTPQFILPLFIMLVYSLFPMLAYMLTKHRLTSQKTGLRLTKYVITILALATHVAIWHVSGWIYYPILDSFGYIEHLK